MRVSNLFKTYRKSINPPYSYRDILVIFFTLLILILIPLTAYAILKVRGLPGEAASPASISLSPANQTVNHNTNFTVEIRENSDTELVNAVQANLTYDVAKLDFVSIDASSSAFNLQFENTGGNGSVKIARSSTTDLTGNQLVAKVTFKAKVDPATTAINFGTGTALVRSTDQANILSVSNGGTYTIVDPAPTVTITSPANNQIVSGTVTVAATASDDVAVTKVEFLVDNVIKATDTSSPYSFSLNTTSLTNTTHTVTAKAYDANSSKSTSITISVDNQAPSAPIGLSATPASGTQINLSWTTSTDNIGVTGYDVYRNNVKIKTVTGTSYNDTGLNGGTSYSYYVRAVDGQGNVSSASNTATATTLIKGDVNQDGKVDIFDASILASKWGTNDPAADLNGNGVVDIFDASILASNWGG
ncbi:MAG: Ig-like domain-containing protein [Candidatus Woykebacteria bacterium]